MNTAREREPQEARSGRELQAEKRTALAAVETGANARQLQQLVDDAREVQDLACILRDAQGRLTHLRRRLRSKVYPVPEYAAFANHVLDLMTALADVPIHRALGSSSSGCRGLEDIQRARGMSTERLDDDEFGANLRTAAEEFAAKLDIEDEDDGLVGQPIGPSAREVERALHSIQLMTEQEEAAQS